MERFRTGIIGCGRVAGLLEDDPLEMALAFHQSHRRGVVGWSCLWPARS